MGVLSLQFGPDFHCEYYRGGKAGQIQAELDELYGVFVDKADQVDLPDDEAQQLLLFFEYLSGDGYGFGVFYTPDAWHGDETSEEQECLIFLVDRDKEAVRAAAASYVNEIVAEQGLTPMPFARDPQYDE